MRGHDGVGEARHEGSQGFLWLEVQHLGIMVDLHLFHAGVGAEFDCRWWSDHLHQPRGSSSTTRMILHRAFDSMIDSPVSVRTPLPLSLPDCIIIEAMYPASIARSISRLLPYIPIPAVPGSGHTASRPSSLPQRQAEGSLTLAQKATEDT